MVSVFHVADGIWLIEPELAREFGSYGLPRSCVAYLVADRKPALIETGPGSVSDAILEGIRRANYEPSDLTYIIPTHIHLDHAGGVGHLVRRLPRAEVLVHERALKHMLEPTRLIEGTRQAFGERFEEEYGPILPVPEGKIRAARDGEVIMLGERELRILYAPGHAPHHMAIFDSKTEGLFAGEALGSYEPGDEIALPAHPPGFELEPALETITKLKSLNPRVIFYSHRGVGQEVGKLIDSVKRSTRSFGDIILQGLRAGETVEQIGERLRSYLADTFPGRDRPRELGSAGIIMGYASYFGRKGMI